MIFIYIDIISDNSRFFIHIYRSKYLKICDERQLARLPPCRISNLRFERREQERTRQRVRERHDVAAVQHELQLPRQQLVAWGKLHSCRWFGCARENCVGRPHCFPALGTHSRDNNRPARNSCQEAPTGSRTQRTERPKAKVRVGNKSEGTTLLPLAPLGSSHRTPLRFALPPPTTHSPVRTLALGRPWPSWLAQQQKRTHAQHSRADGTALEG